MRRGCIAISEVACDGCGRILRHGERYLADDVKSGGTKRLCVDCCAKKGMVGHKRERGQEIMTLFGESLEAPSARAEEQTPAKSIKEKRPRGKQSKAGPTAALEGEKPDA
ncbi:MAG: hypothetical protein AB1597_00840 [Chloroflexota bacterium]